jgi:hypothetical protein
MSNRSSFKKPVTRYRLLGPGPRHVGANVRRITKPLLKSRGLAQGDIVFRWNEIVGAKLASYCYPMKLIPARGHDGGSLTVRVSGAAALEIDHMAPQIVERINTFYGYQAVERLRIEQGPIPRVAKPRQKPLRRLTDSEEMALESEVAPIKDTDLREKLNDLGRLIKTSQ